MEQDKTQRIIIHKDQYGSIIILGNQMMSGMHRETLAHVRCAASVVFNMPFGGYRGE